MKNYHFYGAIYDLENPTYYSWDTEHKWKHYNQIAKVDFFTKEFESLDKADKWFQATYPQYYKGGCISEVDENDKSKQGGDFIFYAVPEYYEYEERCCG